MAAQAMVTASTGAMNSVLSKLATLLEDECNPHTRNRIIALRCALTSMRSFLERRAAASMKDMDPLVEGWMKQVRDMTYDLEDCIDDFVCSDAPGNTNSVAQLIKVVTWRRQYTSLLQELKEQVSGASERRWSAHVGCGLVGIEGSRDRLIKLLDPDDKKQLKMVSIVGSRGIGKTTLAMDVYQSLKERFNCHTIVSVSSGDDLRIILTSILSQVGVQEHDFRECDEEQLIHKLSELLKTRRYFIVIEDIWDVSAWKIIRWAFPDNGCGSRILVTTCISSIASPSCYFGKDDIFKMVPLSDTEARKLFFMRIFHPEDCCPLHLKENSFDILKKCGGIPLAIITVASLLATKSDENEWKRVRDAIGSVFGKSATPEGMKQILHVAYFDLPVHLRTCLLYLSIFPKGYVINKAQLIRRWMGEGFIIEEHVKSSEEVGECYFSELVNRGLIQPVCIRYDGRIESCQVQNMIWDFILSKSSEENFVTRYDDRHGIFGLQDRIRRLSLYCGRHEKDSFILSAITASHIRSLTIVVTDKEMPTLANFQALRVLDVESSGELEDDNYLQKIGKPRLLKYLRLQTKRFTELPEQVAELQFLQTLDLTSALISRLPHSIVRLKQLIYLLVKNIKLPDEIGELQVLQELSHVEVESSNSPNSLEELGRLSRLRVLGLNWCISDTDSSMEICADSLISSLDKLGSSNLQSLHIGTGSGCSLDFLLDSLSAPFNHLHEFRMTSDYYFPKIPGWMTTLVSLRVLEINIDTVGEEALKILGKLPSLLVLLLSVKSLAQNQGLTITSCGFRCLKQFDFICSNVLDMVMFEQGSMLALENLHLKFRVKGVFVNYGFQFDIEHIAALRYLRVDIACEDAEAREMEVVEDAIRSATSTHPGHPRLELRRLGEEDVMHGEGTDVESEEMMEEDHTSPAVSCCPCNFYVADFHTHLTDGCVNCRELPTTIITLSGHICYIFGTSLS
ncbi:hypothetical protein CFC21_105592 [Triticum aestivum]|uniref:NB-ARC domain-containing protein n=2 Tax=Triticum aestivum TaxID=4565 RepID=A0A3B6SP81_WHEAT|nr:hypothetical protein CFC21_105592 [Triticum aestivum]